MEEFFAFKHHECTLTSQSVGVNDIFLRFLYGFKGFGRGCAFTFAANLGQYTLN